MPRKLPQYLRSERRRTGLSQEDVAVLLGTHEFTLRRYERSNRLPPLETALAYEAIFGAPISELFAGTYREISERIRRSAQLRIESLPLAGNSRRIARRKESLHAIATR